MPATSVTTTLMLSRRTTRMTRTRMHTIVQMRSQVTDTRMQVMDTTTGAIMMRITPQISTSHLLTTVAVIDMDMDMTLKPSVLTADNDSGDNGVTARIDNTILGLKGPPHLRHTLPRLPFTGEHPPQLPRPHNMPSLRLPRPHRLQNQTQRT